MTRKLGAVLAVLTVLAVSDVVGIGADEARAQVVGVPVVSPGGYKLRVRPNGVVKVRGRGYAAPVYATPVYDSAVVTTSAVVPTTTYAAAPVVTETDYVAAAPVVTTTRVVTAAPVLAPAAVVRRSAVFPRTYLVPTTSVIAAPVITYP